MRRVMKAFALGALALLALSGCEDVDLTAAGVPTLPSPAVAAEAFTVDEAVTLSAERVVGAEGFDVRFEVPSPRGRYVAALGLRTPYETSLRKVAPALPMSVKDGHVVIRQVALKELPRTGAYPLELWLVNDAGEVSNRVRARVIVQ